MVLGFLLSSPGGIFLAILRPVSTSPPQGGARCPFRARELGFVRSAFWYVFAIARGFAREVFDSSAFDPSAFAFCFVSIFLHSSRLPFSLASFPSLICGSNSSRACRSRRSLECYVPFSPSSVLRLWFSAVKFSLGLRSLAG